MLLSFKITRKSTTDTANIRSCGGPTLNLPIWKSTPSGIGSTYNHAMRWLRRFLVLCVAVWPCAAQTSALAPSGTLRAAFLGDNPVLGRVDGKTGEVTGPVADLVKELARRLGVPYTL